MCSWIDSKSSDYFIIHLNEPYSMILRQMKLQAEPISQFGIPVDSSAPVFGLERAVQLISDFSEVPEPRLRCFDLVWETCKIRKCPFSSIICHDSHAAQTNTSTTTLGDCRADSKMCPATAWCEGLFACRKECLLCSTVLVFFSSCVTKLDASQRPNLPRIHAMADPTITAFAHLIYYSSTVH